MKYAIMDTENTGLFAFKDKATGLPVPADAPGQPRLASIAVILLDEGLRETDAFAMCVKPDGWVMPPEAQAVNGLSTEFLAANGTPISVVLERYAAVIDAGYTLVAYNAQHDLKQLRAEFRRAGLDDRFAVTPNICAMRASMALKVKKASGGGGFPKLSDVCAHFGIPHEGVHTADGDARACLEVFRRLHAMGALPEARVHLAKTPPLAPADDPVVASLAGERF